MHALADSVAEHGLNRPTTGSRHVPGWSALPGQGNTWQGVGPAQPPRSLIHIAAHGRVPVRHPSRTNDATSSGLRAPVDTGPPRPTWNRPRGDARHVRTLRDPGGGTIWAATREGGRV